MAEDNRTGYLLAIGCAMYGGLGSYLAGLALYGTPDAVAEWLKSHPTVRLLMIPAYIAIFLLPALLLFAKWLLSKFRKAPRTNGARSNPSNGLTAIMRIAYDIVASQAINPRYARIRVTLFAPDRKLGDLYQIARYRWDGVSSVTDTRVRFGTCDVGHAWSEQRPFEVAGIAKNGFAGALLECGLTPTEVEAHKLKDRSLFASVPILDRRGQQLAVFSIDAATSNSIPATWHVDLGRSVFPGLAMLLQAESVDDAASWATPSN